MWEGGSFSGNDRGSMGFNQKGAPETPRALDKDMYSGAKALWLLGWYLAICVLLPDAPKNGVTAMVLGGGGEMVVTTLTSEVLAVVTPLGPALLLRLKVLLGGSRALSI